MNRLKLVRDFGISALALTIVLGIMAGGGILLLLQRDPRCMTGFWW